MAITKRKIQALETQSKLMKTAVGLLKHHKIEDVSVNEICEAAGVGIGTFYHYFKSKNDILFAVYNEMDDFFRSAGQGHSELTAYAFILQHCMEYSLFVKAHDLEFTKTVYAMQHPSFCDHSRPVYSLMFTHISQKQTQGKVDSSVDVQELCSYILVLLRGITYDWCVQNGRYDLTEKIVAYLKTALQGYAGLLKHGASTPAHE